MEEEHRRIVGRDVGWWARPAVGVRLFAGRAAQPIGELLAIGREHAEIARRAARQRPPAAGRWVRRPETPGSRKSSSSSAPEQRHQLAAGRVAEAADAVGIDFVLRGVRAQPADRGLAIVDLRGERMLRREAVADRDGRVAMFGETLGHAGQLRPRAHRPGAAVDDEHRRERPVAVRHVDVGLQRPRLALDVHLVADRRRTASSAAADDAANAAPTTATRRIQQVRLASCCRNMAIVISRYPLRLDGRWSTVPRTPIIEAGGDGRIARPTSQDLGQLSPAEVGVTSRFSTIEEAVEAIRRGKVVIVVDAEDRENEGDFVCAAEKVTPEIVNFMITHGRGQLCMPILPEVGQRLELPPMVEDNTAPLGTDFTVPVDHRSTRTGITAAERAATIQAICDPTSKPADFVRPGHLFPLVAKEGGVLRRAGHTEAAVDLARHGRPEAGRRAVRNPRRDRRPGQPRRSCTRWPSSSTWRSSRSRS